MARRSQFLETALIFEHWYGTRRSCVEECLDSGVDVLLVLDAAGHRQLAATHGSDLVSVYLLPPGQEELARRLRSCAQDEEKIIARRLAAAQEEIARASEYQYILVNHDLDRTVNSVDAILHVERMRCGRPQMPFHGS